MKIEISPLIPAMVAAFVISGDTALSKIATILSAAAIHESGHLLAAKALGIPIKRLKIDIFGASMETGHLTCSYLKEAVLAISGPIANILSIVMICLLLPFSDNRLFLIASVFFAAINLLPANGFDGGRVLSCILLLGMSPERVSRFLNFASFLCIFLLWTSSVYFIMRTGAYLSLFVFSGALFAKLFLTSG